ncbi:MAG TPA: response regulator [Candidatus Acidoferrum sp.]|nr:response regulator [Candidatus Acidoferrum sp.]
MPARILVVDDDSLTAELTAEILLSAGMDASFPTSSAEAAERLKREKYHAVFLDMRMPAPDGVELARQIRASNVNASAVIVMITGEEDRTTMRRAFEAGVEFFLFKPVERSKLLKLIRVTEAPIERERWRFFRVRLRCRVSIEAGNERFEGTTLGLSFGGALVQSHRSFPSGTLLTVNLELWAGKSLLPTAVRVIRIVGSSEPIAWVFSLKTSDPRKAFFCKSCSYH